VTMETDSSIQCNVQMYSGIEMDGFCKGRSNVIVYKYIQVTQN